MRYVASLKCAVHTALYHRAVHDLCEDNSFRKSIILEGTPSDEPSAMRGFDLTNMDESIRWDWIVRRIEEQQSAKLIAVSRTFFERGAKAGDMLPGQMIAGGNRRGTHGWCFIDHDHGELLVAKMRVIQKVAAGMLESNNKITNDSKFDSLSLEDQALAVEHSHVYAIPEIERERRNWNLSA